MNLSGEGCTMRDVIPAIPEERKLVVHNKTREVQVHGPEIDVRCKGVFPSRLVQLFTDIACKVNTEYTTLSGPISIPVSNGRTVKRYTCQGGDATVCKQGALP